MKRLKILLILLIPAVGFVGCQKSSMKPGGCQGHDMQSTAAPASTGNTQTTSRVISTTVENDNSTTNSKITTATVVNDDHGTTVVGIGDDDRDGGGKKTIKK